MFEVGATRARSGCRVRGGWFKTFPRYQCKGTRVEETMTGRGGKGRGRGDKAGARSGFQWEESLSLIENSTEYIVQGEGKRRKAKECARLSTTVIQGGWFQGQTRGKAKEGQQRLNRKS